MSFDSLALFELKSLTDNLILNILFTLPFSSVHSSYAADVMCSLSSTRNLNTSSFFLQFYKLKKKTCSFASHWQANRSTHGGSLIVPYTCTVWFSFICTLKSFGIKMILKLEITWLMLLCSGESFWKEEVPPSFYDDNCVWYDSLTMLSPILWDYAGVISCKTKSDDYV